MGKTETSRNCQLLQRFISITECEDVNARNLKGQCGGCEHDENTNSKSLAEQRQEDAGKTGQKEKSKAPKKRGPGRPSKKINMVSAGIGSALGAAVSEVHLGGAVFKKAKPVADPPWMENAQPEMAHVPMPRDLAIRIAENAVERNIPISVYLDWLVNHSVAMGPAITMSESKLSEQPDNTRAESGFPGIFFSLDEVVNEDLLLRFPMANALNEFFAGLKDGVLDYLHGEEAGETTQNTPQDLYEILEDVVDHDIAVAGKWCNTQLMLENIRRAGIYLTLMYAKVAAHSEEYGE